MKLLVSVILTIFLFNTAFASSAVKFHPNTKWLTVATLKESLVGKKPMSVGFDVDDTVLFSSPVFFYGSNKYSKGSRKFLGNIDFWNEANNGLDRFSMPKEIAKELISYHQKRGDTIYFITARTQTKTENLTEILKGLFSITNMKKVIFTGRIKRGDRISKAVPIKEHNVKIFYGDSDGDIRAATKAKVRPIRIIRAGNSGHKPYPVNGGLAEEVLRNSEY